MANCRIATCTVTYDGFSDPTGTPQRIYLLKKATYELSKEVIDLFALPGGYLFSKGGKNLEAIQSEIVKLASDTGVDLLVGVDINRKKINPEPVLIERGKLNALSIFAPHKGQVERWRQRTTTRRNQGLVSNEVCQQVRLVRIQPRIEALICGEIFNERIRRGLIGRKTAIVMDQGHTAFGFRVHAAMKVLAARGISSLCSVHSSVKGAVKHCYVPHRSGWKKRSSRKIDLIVGKEPRIEIKIWCFDSNGTLMV